MTIAMYPPSDRRCQIYGQTSVRCVNTGTRWVKLQGNCLCYTPAACTGKDCAGNFYTWECDGPHLFGGGDTASIPHQREAA